MNRDELIYSIKSNLEDVLEDLVELHVKYGKGTTIQQTLAPEWMHQVYIMVEDSLRLIEEVQ